MASGVDALKLPKHLALVVDTLPCVRFVAGNKLPMNKLPMNEPAEPHALAMAEEYEAAKDWLIGNQMYERALECRRCAVDLRTHVEASRGLRQIAEEPRDA